MVSRHQTNAKSHERRTCRALGGERNGPNPGSDCIGTVYAVEAKRQVKLSLRADHLAQAKRQGEKEGKPWILVQQEHGSDEPVLTCSFKWFAEVLHPLYVASLQPVKNFWCGAATPEVCGTQCGRCALEHPS